jgi:acetyltransferase
VKAATSAEEAVQNACDVGFPVAIKINSRDITHKSDAQTVFLNLNDEYAVRDAFFKAVNNAKKYNPAAKIDGVTIQQMVKYTNCELILGIKRDRDFGPVILFGIGGIFTEVLEDYAIAFPPLNRLLARKLIEQTKVYRLLRGYRNIPPAKLDVLEEILIRLAQLATDFSEIEELDVNPLVITPEGVCAVDARVLLKSSPISAPHHLVISPYPDQYESHTRTSVGIDIFVRPIRPEDASLLVDLFDSLSTRSVYMRFFTPLKRLPQSMLARFTQIDYDREIALVAMSESESEEKMLGVARVIMESNRKHAEFSVVVADPWQGKGIGAELLRRCLEIAKEQKIEKVWGVVLSENTQMLALGKKFGFTFKRVPGAGEYELSLDFFQPVKKPIRKSESVRADRIF